ncbi:MAG: hypothetical protein IJZ65_06520 [Ruminiclostridium sp.]|nr:hypothetical protein [Ruminiclostridium sp.]
MKEVLFVVGIVLIILCVLSLLFAGLNWFGYYNLLDGSSEQYARLRSRMIIFLITGIILAVIGIASLIAQSEIVV